jgi:hypothetical protein
VSTRVSQQQLESYLWGGDRVWTPLPALRSVRPNQPQRPDAVYLAVYHSKLAALALNPALLAAHGIPQSGLAAEQRGVTGTMDRNSGMNRSTVEST